MGRVERMVRKLREEKGLSQYALGKLVGTSQTQIARYDSERGHILAEDLPAFAKALDTTVNYLLTGVNDENVALAEDLDLTDYSITFLREWNKKVQNDRKNEEIVIIRNEYKVIIDILAHNPEFVGHLFQYFRRYDFQSFVYKVDDFGDGEDVDYEKANVKDIVGFPIEDLERVYRLRLLDEIKALRDGFEQERNQLYEEDLARDREVAKRIEESYHQQHREMVEQKEESDEEYYQKMVDNILVQISEQKKEENEDGKS